jgi:hypothetical protein
MAADRLFAFVEAEDRLEGDRLPPWSTGAARHQGVVDAPAEPSLVREVQDAAALDVVEAGQLFLQLVDRGARQPCDRGSVQAQELRKVKQRPGALGLGRRIALGEAAPERVTQAGKRTRMARHRSRGVGEGCAVEQQPHRQEVHERCRCDANRRAVGSLLELAHDPGPPPKRQRARHHEVVPLVLRHAEHRQGAQERRHRRAACSALLPQQRDEPADPRSGRGQGRLPMDREEAAVQPALATGHRPVGEALVQERCQEADE